MWTPRLLRSQSEGLFLEVAHTAQFGQQMVLEREWGTIYSKQIFYPWQVMERATTLWRFNKRAQAKAGRTRLKWDRVTSQWLWNADFGKNEPRKLVICLLWQIIYLWMQNEDSNTRHPLIFSKREDSLQVYWDIHSRRPGNVLKKPTQNREEQMSYAIKKKNPIQVICGIES